MISLIVILVVTLLFSAFFSGMEIAYISSSKLKLEIDRKKNKTFGRIANILIKNPGQYIAAILVGNNITLVIFSLNMAILLNYLASRFGMETLGSSILIKTLISTIIIVFAAEFLPKAIVRNNPNFYFRTFAGPLYILYMLLYPVAKFTTWLSVLLLRMFGLKVDSSQNIKPFFRIELAQMLEEATENEEKKAENEMKMFRNALGFTDLRVRDFMVHRVNVEAVDVSRSIGELSARFVDTNYSRIFIYDGTIDNIIGYVNVKSLFDSPDSVRGMLMEVDYVPESLSAQKLLTMLIKKRRAVAVVIDEFGGTAGIVSMEDALEEIFGEIEDEYDMPEFTEKSVGEGTFVLSGQLEVDYLNEKYSLGIPESDEYHTLAGYIIYNHEGIPLQGDIVIIGNKEFRMLRISGSKLDLVKVTILK